MTFHVRVAGTWEEVTEPSIRPSGSYVPVETIHVRVAGVWEEVFASGPACSPNTGQIFYEHFSQTTIYATVEFRNNGTEYKNSAATDSGNNTSRGNWLDSGTTSEVWMVRIINSGTLNRFDAGSGRLAMTTSRKYGISRSTNGTKTTNMTFQFWDAASGGNLLATVTYDLKVTLDFL